MMTFHLHLALLLGFTAFAGVGTLGTQVLGYGYVSNYYTTQARSAGVSWFVGFGRLGGVAGPFVGGLLATWNLGGAGAFYVFAGVAVFGALIVAFVPRQPEDKNREVDATSIDLTVKSSDLKTVKAS